MARPPGKAYHHGDLRAALIEAAFIVLETRGPAALSLRDVARRAGVSEAAPYRHFADKAALIDAVIMECRTALEAEVGGAMAPYRGEGRNALLAGLRAYLDVAADQAGRFGLLQRGLGTTGPEAPDLEPLFVAEAATPWAGRALWLALHGAAVLIQAGRLDRAAAEATLRHMIDGV